MTFEQIAMVVTGAVALVALLVAVSAWHRAGRAVSMAQALSQQTAPPESPVVRASRPVVDDSELATFVITHIDDEGQQPVSLTPQRIEGRLFADIVARETIVKAASWTHGVRRALSPQTRNRIRFHMRQETKQAGRDRKAEMKIALREYRARGRADEEDVA